MCLLRRENSASPCLLSLLSLDGLKTSRLTHPEERQICDQAQENICSEDKVSCINGETTLCRCVECLLAYILSRILFFPLAGSCFSHIILGTERKAVVQDYLLIL